MERTLIGLLVALCLGCGAHEDASGEAGVGGDRTGCEEPGSHSVKLSEHSCSCESGYAWCSTALDDFDCCAIDEGEGESETGEPSEGPSLPCDAEHVEQLTCELLGVGDPGGSSVWACNGERWVEVPGYATFACTAKGFTFAYGCAPGEPEPQFLCGHGQGSACDPVEYGGVCIDDDIIDTCVWGRRTVDRCSRLCVDLEAFGQGFSGGACSQDPDAPATCSCD